MRLMHASASLRPRSSVIEAQRQAYDTADIAVAGPSLFSIMTAEFASSVALSVPRTTIAPEGVSGKARAVHRWRMTER